MRRYLETLFRHKVIFLIPVLATPIIAVIAVLSAGKQYEVAASIWVVPSPVADTISARSRGATPNEVEAQALRDRLSTDAFRNELIDRAGLRDAVVRGDWPSHSPIQEALGTGPSAIEKIGDVLSVSTQGDNLLRVIYRGSEPILGKRLVDETINLFNEKTLEVQLAQVRSTGVEPTITDRNRSFQVIDPAVVPSSANYSQRSPITVGFLGLTLGLVLGFVPIVWLTWMDNRVRTREDVEQVVEPPVLAQVPVLGDGKSARNDRVRAAIVRQALTAR